MDAEILGYPATFDRVDKVKLVAGEPVLRGDDQLWILGQSLRYIVDGVHRTVPAGFTTDGASIPSIGRWITGWRKWDEPQRWAAIIHDWLYCEADVAKVYGDAVFRAILDTEGASWFRTTIMHAAVVIGGGPAYRANQSRGPRIYQ